MLCPKCGADVPDNQKFCHDCGTTLKGVTDPTERVDEVGTDEAHLPALSHLPTAEIVPSEPLPEPVWAAPATADPTEETDLVTASNTTTEIVATQVSTTEELPAVFDGHDDLGDLGAPAPLREPFQLRLILVLAVLGAVAVLMSIAADITDIRTTRPTSGITTGVSTLDEFGSNLAAAALFGSAVMLLGGVLACYGLRWGAGLAGGAGLALFGWAALVIGLAEFPIAVAESITRTSTEAFTLKVTRDLGWWLIAGVGVVGALVFISSLRSFRSTSRVALNPWIAAVGAVSMVVLAAGPLVPVGAAQFADNFRSPNASIDLPTVYFAGRLAQVGLIAAAGVIGLLIVRSYGLGLAVGGISVSLWLWFTSLAETGDHPVGIADRNPGSLDTVPHGVTTLGMVLSIALLAGAAVFASVQLQRSNTVYGNGS